VREKYDYRLTLQDFGRTLSSTTELDPLLVNAPDAIDRQRSSRSTGVGNLLPRIGAWSPDSRLRGRRVMGRR
jgi:hypothetical protein